VNRQKTKSTFGAQPVTIRPSAKIPTAQWLSLRWIENCALSETIDAPAGASNDWVAAANGAAVPAFTLAVAHLPRAGAWAVGHAVPAVIATEAVPIHEWLTPPGAASQATTS
jgi:hypothetical protein